MGRFFDIWNNVIRNPTGFFNNMPKEGGFAEPVSFAFINYLAFAVGILVLKVIYSTIIFLLGINTNDLISSIIISIFLYIIFIPVFCIIALFIIGAILFGLFKILNGKGSYEGTVSILSYSSAVYLLAWIPIAGWLFTLYQIYLNIIGGKFVHSLTTSGSAIAVLILYVLIVLVTVIIIVGIMIIMNLIF